MNNLSHGFLSVALVAIPMIAVNGCHCTVHVDEDDDDYKPKMLELPRDTVEIVRIGRSLPQFTSTITAVDGPVRIRVTGEDRNAEGVLPDFDVVFNPASFPQEVRADFMGGPTILYSPGPTLVAWFHFNGAAPVGRTRRVRAVGSGTEFIINVTASYDYVYMIGDQDDYVDVYALLSSTPHVICQTLTAGQYISVDDNGVCSAPANYIDDPVHAEFVSDALESYEF